jgi:uncharacterized protein YprB with RNaseH-like and TPR domain
MLQNTFQHLPGVGKKTENRLWMQDFHNWENLLHSPSSKPVLKKIAVIRNHLEESKIHLQQENVKFFEDSLPSNLHWRFFPEFRGKAVYLDIETDGLDFTYGSITTIALFDGKQVSCYVHGHNMDAFLLDIKQYDLIITYNGKCFDIPFIENYFNIQLHQAQIDLRYVLASLGYKGGLKKCEVALGIDRGDLSDMDGFFAVLLWKEYQKTGNSNALDTLLSYNVEDTVNLEKLMVMAYNLNLKETPFYEEQKISAPSEHTNPYPVDLEIVNKLRKQSALSPSFSFGFNS